MARINRELEKHGVEDYFELSLVEKAKALEAIPESEYGIYADQIIAFIDYVNSMEKVIEIGGLHVIGSERHEARRIDNQLRGRAARQGDPGSSRFYLSMEDDLMRLFGGQQMEVMMQRLGMDEQMPLEVGVVGRIIEGAQTRVEGANFDSRKHILEYDDVLNSQRNTIYKQRDRIFLKEDLSEDILELLEAEINARIPETIEPEYLPTLLYWLSVIQPSFSVGEGTFPSFTNKLLLDEILSKRPGTQEKLVNAVLELADKAAGAYQDRIVEEVTRDIERFVERIDLVHEDRIEGMNTFFEQLYYADETQRISDQDILNAVKDLTRLEIKAEVITSGLQSKVEQAPSQPQGKSKSKYSKKKGRRGKSASLRNSTLILDNLDEAQELLEEEIYRAVNMQALERLIGAVNRRLPEELDLDVASLNGENWDTITESITTKVAEVYYKRRERFNRDNQSGGMLERLENLFRYDLFVDHTTAALKRFFNGPAPMEITSGRQLLEKEGWKSIGNQINIYIDRRKIGSAPDMNLLEENQQLLEEALAELDPATWNVSSQDWSQVKDAILRYLENNYQNWIIAQLINAFRMMYQERKTVFTKGSKGTQYTNWFSFRHYAAGSLENLTAQELRQMFLEHLQEAHLKRMEVFGLKVWRRLSPDWQVSDLLQSVQDGFAASLPEGRFSEYADAAIRDIQGQDVDIFIQQLGQFELSEYYREIFLRVISSLWIEYLTEMEALRVKIGLEAYAQRDPLVAYKTQASEMFQNLFNQMQRDVVNQMFRNRGRLKGQNEERLALIEKIRETRRETLVEEHSVDQEDEAPEVSAEPTT